MTDIDIVVVNYKSAAHTVKCAEAASSVARADRLTAQIIVVNNGDDDHELDSRLSQIPDVQILSPKSNLGFAAACNMAAVKGEAPFILFINPDAALATGALKSMTSFLTAPDHRVYGIVGPELRNGDGDVVASCSKLPNLIHLMMRTAGLHRLLPNSGYPYLPLEAHAKSGPVDQVMGAALMIRRSVFDALDGFDERYFLYYEDVDLSLRAKQSGALSYYLKVAHATHEGRVSSSQDTGLTLALHIRSRLTFARRHYGVMGWLMLLLTCVVVECPVRLLQALVGVGQLSVSSVLRAYSLLLRSVVSANALPGARTEPAVA